MSLPVPPPPPGYKLDQPSSAGNVGVPPPPPGYQLDHPPLPPGYKVDYSSNPRAEAGTSGQASGDSHSSARHATPAAQTQQQPMQAQQSGFYKRGVWYPSQQSQEKVNASPNSGQQRPQAQQNGFYKRGVWYPSQQPNEKANAAPGGVQQPAQTQQTGFYRRGVWYPSQQAYEKANAIPLEGLWNWINTGLIKPETILNVTGALHPDPRKTGTSFDKRPGESTAEYVNRIKDLPTTNFDIDHPAIGAITRGLFGAASDLAGVESSFTSPLSIALLGFGTLGKALPALARLYPELAPLLRVVRPAQVAVGAAMGAQGAQQMSQGAPIGAVVSAGKVLTGGQPTVSPEEAQRGLMGSAQLVGGAASVMEGLKPRGTVPKTKGSTIAEMGEAKPRGTVPKTPAPTEAEVEKAAIDQVTNHREELEQKYVQDPATKLPSGGILRDGDIYKKILMPEGDAYENAKKYSDAVHQSSSEAAVAGFRDDLTKLDPDRPVAELITGMAGSGKTTIALETAKSDVATAISGNFSDPVRVKGYINEIVKSGHRPRIVHVFVDPVNAFERAVYRGAAEGRYLSYAAFKRMAAVNETILQMAEKHAGLGIVEFEFYDNNGPYGSVHEITLDEFRQLVNEEKAKYNSKGRFDEIIQKKARELWQRKLDGSRKLAKHTAEDHGKATGR